MKQKTIVLVTGGFDPIHSGHLAYLEEAKKLGDELWVGLNSDAWLTRKKGRPFMPINERVEIIKRLYMVDAVIDFDDSDDSACGAIFKTKSLNSLDNKIIFANGGDRTYQNIPEMLTYGDDPNVEFKFSVGGDIKKNSSSWILEDWKNPKVERQWGWYRELYTIGNGIKVKELVIEPGKSLSMQRHFKRAEMWYVLKGMCKCKTELNGVQDDVTLQPLNKGYDIGTEVWHQGYNPFDEPCHILEVQHGELCVEEDIERREEQ
jgi:D-beta-D-heptose 7-phosphate kinase/D-beta-D-heptose 1-phosphate adenosyltransferase